MTKFFNASSLALTVASAMAAITPAPASAQSIDAPISVSVPYADLDIGHASGARVLLQRIQSASIRACGGEPDIRGLRERAAFDQCRKVTTSKAVAQVASPMLTAMAEHDLPPVRVAGR